MSVQRNPLRIVILYKYAILTKSVIIISCLTILHTTEIVYYPEGDIAIVTGSAKPSMLVCKFWPVFRCLKSQPF